MAQYNAEPLERLINNFSRLNGVGRKGATRMAYQVLAMDENAAKEFAAAILDVHTKIKRCPVCQNFTDKDICPICASTKRDESIICIVESPRDVATFEKTREYKGLYHVLHGLISPMDGITAEQLTVKELLARLQNDKVKEVIMATSSTIEGETTAMYISRLVKPLGIRVTRLAYGLPVGASLEYADEVTLYRALEGRREI
ncbi:MAG: recombination protein RecR [Oscillospiraceae bacterium]|nr:recombination protein RecR [Oscillospiraceae bacterium]